MITIRTRIVLFIMGRMGKVGRDYIGSPGPTSLLKLGHSRAHSTGLCLDVF